MARHGPRRPDLLPKQDGGKVQTGDEDRQNQAADSRAPKTEPPSPGQHPSLQLVQAPAHPGSSFCLAFMLAAAPIVAYRHHPRELLR